MRRLLDVVRVQPCPNPSCGFEHPRLRPGAKATGFIECPRCDMEGPRGKSPTDAIHLWNALPRFVVTPETRRDTLIADLGKLRRSEILAMPAGEVLEWSRLRDRINTLLLMRATETRGE